METPESVLNEHFFVLKILKDLPWKMLLIPTPRNFCSCPQSWIFFSCSWKMNLGVVSSLTLIQGLSFYVFSQVIFVALILSLLEFVYGKPPPARQHDDIQNLVLQMGCDSIQCKTG